jgi:hypothetical protein
MNKIYLFALFVVMSLSAFPQSATVIPNAGFETWIDYGDYENPQDWDTPNQELSAIPFFGTTVVTKSTDNNSGVYSARLESKNILLVGDIPGFMTLGNLTIDITNLSYNITGGVPVVDVPTHLKGFYKFFPKGGDSCAIAIGLSRWTGTMRDSIGIGTFSTKDTVPDWTPFSARIDYDTTAVPDSMIIMCFSSAQEVLTPGTVLYVDDLWLDYAVGINESDPSAGIDTYNDRETRRLLIFTDFGAPQSVIVNLYSMSGRKVFSENAGRLAKTKVEVSYDGYSEGIYILEVIHNNLRYATKYFISRN